MTDSLHKQARTFMPEILAPGTGLSPLTNKSVVPTNNVPTLLDVLNGKQYKLPGAGGNWGTGEDVDHNYRGDGNDGLRNSRFIDILNNMAKPISSGAEEWTVRTEGGKRTFNSFQEAQTYKRKLKDAGFAVKWISRTKTAQSNNLSKIDVVNMALQRTYKVVVRRLGTSIESNGSAFCVAPNKFLTCAHVVKRYDKMAEEKISLLEVDRTTSIFLTNGPKKFPAKVIGIDETNDIALLECKCNAAPFSVDTQFNIGDEILAVGSPHGFENNVSFGHITSRDKKIYPHANAPLYMFIDANVFGGNSGGPIVNIQTGRVVGMVTAIAAAQGEYGLNSGLPAEYLVHMCEKNRTNIEHY